MLTANVAALLLTGMLGFLTLRRIVNPIQALERSVRTIAAGDYSQSVPFTSATDETGGLARSIEVRFFGLFYTGTALTAVLIQASLGRVVLGRLALGGSVASHSAVVGATSVLGFALPIPVGGILARGDDLVVRGSTFRAGYEMLYTPLAEATKRSAQVCDRCRD
jgi:HAMP domain-containing protein